MAEGDSSAKGENSRPIVLEKKRENVFRSGLKESREGFSRRGRGRSCYIKEGPKTEERGKQQLKVCYEGSGG